MSSLQNPTLPSIGEINHLSQEEFTRVISLLFEPTALLASRIYDSRPFESYDQLLDKADEQIKQLSPLEQLGIVNAHPRIGESADKLSELSRIEQGKAADNEESLKLKWAQLNKEYEDKYGFRFVIFVNGRSKESLIPIIEKRIANGYRNVELATGLSEMVDIARDRVKKLQSATQPSAKI
ncbi:hypothetical protein COEREDRAFT_37843 [Coemansia reversa NRRL 1564]|uniref:Oxo-4-hydroxy-4-carboxy-5-ureidoimidazoline decarboxylase domain-containing protein n=1 Tax=Coemansia reversa (strain ATCC 12441 / NRRL 1564) TaxID=763665 RepID=A0A2G5BJU0_COERN|nr:hypothetical protein COEREDRAFT_37843 [Coemansia reversa NRRL 1564]|eukprot:PIA19269.1 hypothetical protein COEREDRAFT_37843 [Coemansia reversa NRRL 1564]